ncbi:nucleotidyltransferase family protein [Sphingomonas sp. GC_Shp_3]|uniref:nucleotidyltransferase family protein n=1 Tax=Sphingomonas sp. GC_Shp_3 TaxID=2937383 RepID=UPI002269EC39|nr:nucleotidyltransferase family protein [Sphingomonas sp. GC_Shp_3]
MTDGDRLTPERTALVLLAAGRSSRFGAADKLAADLFGRPLGLHVAATLAPLPFAARIAVCGGTAPDYAAHGFEMLFNPRAAEGASTSVALGVAAARTHGCDAVLIALADMPCVTTAHIQRLFDASDNANTVVASSDGVRLSPPALFSAAHFDTLASLSGDQGARDLIRSGRHIVTRADELIDIDTEADLAALHHITR